MSSSVADSSPLDRLNSLLSRFEAVTGVVAALAIFAVMAIVTVDVALRYALNAPLPWSYDLIGLYLVPLMFFFVLSLTFSSNHHIAVDIVYLRMTPALRRLCRLIIAFISLMVFVPITWLAAIGTISRLQADEVISGTILWPTWIPEAFMFIGCVLLCLRLVSDAVSLMIALLGSSSRVAGESPDRDRVVEIAEDLP